MKLRFLAKSVGHVSCKGVNLSKDEVGEFEDSVARNLLESLPRDFEVVEASKDKDAKPQKNKMLRKSGKYKSK